LFLSTGSQLCLMLWGAIVSLHEDWAKAHRWWVLSVFVVLVAIGVGATIKQSVKSAQEMTTANTKLSGSIDALRVSSDENARLARLNSELQGRLLDQSTTVSDLAKQAINSTTGGDNFCYMNVESVALQRGLVVPIFHHYGKYPLYDVEARIFDIITADLLGEQHPGGGDSAASIGAVTLTVPIGNVPVNAAFTPNNPPVIFSLKSRDTLAFNVFFHSRNGFWRQNLRGRWIDGAWRMASQVVMDDSKGRNRVLRRNVDRLYPRDKRGGVVWDIDRK
jgi:hypothetical protein